MRLVERYCKMYSTITFISALIILCSEAAPGVQLHEEDAAGAHRSEAAFTNFPQFPISPYFGSVEDFAQSRSQGKPNAISKDDFEQEAIVFNSRAPFATVSLISSNDGLVPESSIFDGSHKNHISGSSDNETSDNDIWANVPLANINGFIMPIVPPVFQLPKPNPGTLQPEIDSTRINRSRSDNSGLGSSEPSISRKKSISRRTLSEVYPTDLHPFWSKFLNSSLDRNARSISSDADPLPVMCGEFNLVPGSSLHLASPYYPANYPDNFSCRWSIKAVAGEKVAVKCHSFELSIGDYLAVGVEGDPTSLVRYTAVRALSFVVLPSNEVFISFFSDGAQQSKGFSCTAYSMGVEDEDSSQTVTPAPVPSPPHPGPGIEDLLQQSDLSHPECGLVNRPSSRIVNGQPADENEYPWQVYLKIRWEGGGVSGCGGSLISQDWVLTAAHCVLPAKTIDSTTRESSVLLPKVTVLVGAHDINSVPGSGASVIESSRVIVHPKNSFSYDLALIELSKSVIFGPQVGPVCLPTPSMQEKNLTGMPMAVIGWGNTETGAQPKALRELGQQGLEWSSCKRVYGDYITEHHFCTTSTKGGHICLGDSGGPTMIAEGGRYYIRGVISFVATKECNLDFPDGHTSVTHFLTWIQTVTGLTV